MSTLSDIVANLESAGGRLASVNAANNPTMVNTTFGQYKGFVNEYGSGASGVDNYASQVLAANPGATLGDFYASYVLGTGNPANLHSIFDLQSSYPGAFTNLIKNAGFSLNTPLSNIINGITGGNASAANTANSIATSAGNSIGSVLNGIGNSFFSLGTTERVVAVVIGIILIGIAMVFLLGQTSTGQQVIEQVKEGVKTGAATAAVA